MMSQTGQQLNTIHVQPNTSDSKDNQAMIFGQFIEYNRNILLEKPYTKRGGEAVPDPSIKNQNCA